MREIILISGYSRTGKTSLAKSLKKQFNFNLLDVQKTSKKDLVSWVDKEIKDKFNTKNNGYPIVIDYIRDSAELKKFRNKYNWRVTHIHLYASKDTANECEEVKSETAKIEKGNIELDDKTITYFKDDADVRININKSNEGDVLVRVAARLGLYSPPDIRCVDVLIGGQYGSEGKGNIAAYLAREYSTLVRVGGPNAGHTIIKQNGKKYTHHQLPSGCQDIRAKILLGPGMTIHESKLLQEIKECKLKGKNRLFIDPQAMIISEEDCKNEEQGLKGTISSTASGSGYASARRIMNRGENDIKLSKDATKLGKYVSPIREKLEESYKNNEKILLEGTQGSGLSIYHGEYPYVTSRDTNVAGCLAEAGISPSRVRKVIMVVRYTPIRVANPEEKNSAEKNTSGTIKHETTWEDVAKYSTRNIECDEIKEEFLNELLKNEKTSTTKRERRVGWFDWELFRKACSINAPTDIVLTFSDYIDIKNREARRFEQLTEETIKFIEELERVAQAPVSLICTRFPDFKSTKSHDKRAIIDRRNWVNSNLEDR